MITIFVFFNLSTIASWRNTKTSVMCLLFGLYLTISPDMQGMGMYMITFNTIRCHLWKLSIDASNFAAIISRHSIFCCNKNNLVIVCWFVFYSNWSQLNCNSMSSYPESFMFCIRTNRMKSQDRNIVHFSFQLYSFRERWTRTATKEG